MKLVLVLIFKRCQGTRSGLSLGFLRGEDAIESPVASHSFIVSLLEALLSAGYHNAVDKREQTLSCLRGSGIFLQHLDFSTFSPSCRLGSVLCSYGLPAPDAESHVSVLL